MDKIIHIKLSEIIRPTRTLGGTRLECVWSKPQYIWGRRMVQTKKNYDDIGHRKTLRRSVTDNNKWSIDQLPTYYQSTL